MMGAREALRTTQAAGAVAAFGIPHAVAANGAGASFDRAAPNVPPAAPTPDLSSAAASPTVRRLAEIGADERARFGNKAWRLAALARAGLPVPEGFAIADDAFAADGTLPAATAAAVRTAWRGLDAGRVAVRSSASDEDLDEASGAGLYASLLNVGDEAGLFAAIAAVRAARPATARPDAGLAVLVQAQVDADAAGILFTAEARGGDGALLVNVVPGLGEPLAAGRCDGDTFRLAADGRLLHQRVRAKATMLTPAGEAPVPPGRRRRPTLTAPQLKRLAALAAAVRRVDGPGAFGGRAIDLEFAFAGSRPLLLQARAVPAGRLPPIPETDDVLEAWLRGERRRLVATAHALRTAGRVRGADVVWSAGNVAELLPTPSRFSFALFCRIFEPAIAEGRRRLGYRIAPDAGAGLFALFGGQPWFNLECDAATYDIGIAPAVAALLDAVARDPAQASYPELALYPRLLAEAPGGAETLAGFEAAMREHATRQRRRFDRLVAWLARREAGRASEPAATGAAALSDAIRREIDFLARLGVRFVIAARLGFFFAERLRARLRPACGSEAAFARRTARLLQGLPGSRVTEQGFALETVARGEASADDFLARYGHLADVELELDAPRLAERPERLATLLAELRAAGRSPRADFARLQAARRRTERALESAFGGEHNVQFFSALAAAQHYLPLRETLKDHLAAGTARLRTLLLRLETTLGWPAGLIFHLEPDEVLALPAGAAGRAALAELAELAATRRAERELARRAARERPLPPALFASRPQVIGAAPEDADRGDYAAEPIAPGQAEGIVRRVDRDEGHERSEGDDAAPVTAGEILVAASANLGLAPRFRTVAGVVVEVGGVLAHCACQAREAGIPALVLRGATRLLADGDRVRLDAARGRVIVLERAGGPR